MDTKTLTQKETEIVEELNAILLKMEKSVYLSFDEIDLISDYVSWGSDSPSSYWVEDKKKGWSIGDDEPLYKPTKDAYFKWRDLKNEKQ